MGLDLRKSVDLIRSAAGDVVQDSAQWRRLREAQTIRWGGTSTLEDDLSRAIAAAKARLRRHQDPAE